MAPIHLYFLKKAMCHAVLISKLILLHILHETLIYIWNDKKFDIIFLQTGIKMLYTVF